MTIPTYKNNIDLSGNALLNHKLEHTAVLPGTPFEGNNLVDTSGGAGNSIYRVYLNGVWVDVGTGITTITSSTTALTAVKTGLSYAIALALANGTNAGLMSSTHYDDANNATASATNGTIVKRDGVTGGVTLATVSLTTGTISTTPSNVNDLVNKSYVDSAVASGGSINDIDCSANPDYPVAAKGDLYHVTVAGRIGGAAGELVEVGDSFKAKAIGVTGDQATVGSNWIIMQNNLDAATTTVSGHIRIATPAEVTAGVLTNVAVSPANLASGSLGKSIGLIGDGSATDIVYTHNLGEQFCQVQVYDAITNGEIGCGTDLTNTTTCTLSFSVAPASNEFRVVVIG
jgi:hypothetical protein